PEEGTQGGAGQIPAGGGGGGVCVLHGGGPEVDLRHMLVPIGTSVNGRSPVLGMRRMARCHHPPVSTCRDALPSKGTEHSSRRTLGARAPGRVRRCGDGPEGKGGGRAWKDSNPRPMASEATPLAG